MTSWLAIEIYVSQNVVKMRSRESREKTVAMHAQSREKKVSDGAVSEAEVVWIGCNSQQVPLCRLVARRLQEAS
jgi:hypothetical protein